MTELLSSPSAGLRASRRPVLTAHIIPRADPPNSCAMVAPDLASETWKRANRLWQVDDPKLLTKVVQEVWDTTHPTAGLRDPSVQIITTSRRTMEMICGAGFTHHCSLPTGRLPPSFFSRFSRNTMKLNNLGIIFSETKAKQARLPHRHGISL